MGNEVGHSDVHAPSTCISSSAKPKRGVHHIYPCSSSFLNSFCLVYRLITKRRVVRKITCGSGGQKMRVFSVCMPKYTHTVGMTLLNKKRRSHTFKCPCRSHTFDGRAHIQTERRICTYFIYLCDGHI